MIYLSNFDLDMSVVFNRSLLALTEVQERILLPGMTEVK